MPVVEWAVRLFLAYGALGILFAILFAIFGIHRVDPAAKGSDLAFRLIAVPGAAALWPLLLRRWIRSES